jgi:hypothetical protein
MQTEPIYIKSAKVMVLEKLIDFYKGNFYGNLIKIKEIEKIGHPFSFKSNENLNNPKEAQDKLEKTFQNQINPASLVGSLVDYLNLAGVDMVLARREDNKIQYLGITYENPVNSKSNIKKNTITCQFYLIKDNLQLETYFRNISPASESSPNHSPASDLTSQLPTSRIHHPQEFCYF